MRRAADRVVVRRLGLWLPAYFVVAALAPFVFGDRYLLETLLTLNLYLVFVLSWDVFCGPTREANFGHTFFIGGAAYSSGLLHLGLGLPIWASGLASLVVVLAVGAGIGWIADRVRGPSFALATMGFQLMLFQAVFLFPGIFGAEEGLIGLPPVAESWTGRHLVVVGAAAGVALVRHFLLHSRAGLLLTAVGEDEELARSSGVRSRRLKVAVFALSATLGGVGGILYAHTQGQVNSELVGSGLAVQIVLLGLVGGARTGPAAAVILFFLLQRLMAGVVPMQAVVYAVLLLMAVLLFPRGIVPRAVAEEP